jgi:4-carboxymuconolactone decarboxylase
MHIRAAIGNGVTPSEITEVLLHTSVYAGVPAANSAFAIAQRVLMELGAPEATTPYRSSAPGADAEADAEP